MCPTVPPRIIHRTESQLPAAVAHSVMLLSLLPPRPSLRCLGWPPNKLLAPESLFQHLPEVDPRKSPPPCSCHTASTQNWVCSPHFSPERQPEEPPASQPQAPKANSSQPNLSVSYSRSGLPLICPEGTFHTSSFPSVNQVISSGGRREEERNEGRRTFVFLECVSIS